MDTSELPLEGYAHICHGEEIDRMCRQCNRVWYLVAAQGHLCCPHFTRESGPHHQLSAQRSAAEVYIIQKRLKKIKKEKKKREKYWRKYFLHVYAITYRDLLAVFECTLQDMKTLPPVTHAICPAKEPQSSTPHTYQGSQIFEQFWLSSAECMTNAKG